MNRIQISALIALVFSGAIFGFFYAWVCSTMWGLDQIDPTTAIKAMNAMNASVRNPVFFPAFFLTPLVVAIAATLSWREGEKAPALWMALAVVLYVMGAFLPTASINVPMNEALAQISDKLTNQDAQEVWASYSQPWQLWNTIRTVASGLALLCVGWAMLLIRPTS